MESPKQSHTIETALYSTSRALERAAYYGFRGLIVLYMIGSTLSMDMVEAAQLYAWFTMAIYISQVLGAVLGDLLIGNKNAIIIGGLLQASGAFAVCHPSVTGLFAGLVLILLGGGLYTPNIIAQFGKEYINKPKIIDSGFGIFYLAVNLGAFLGAFFVGYYGDANFIHGFILVGILNLVSVGIMLFIKKKTVPPQISFTAVSKRVALIITVIFLSGLYWLIYGFSDQGLTGKIVSIQQSLPLNAKFDVSTIFTTYSSLISLIAGVALCLIWMRYYSNQFVKLLIGFLLAAGAFAVLLIIPENSSGDYVNILYLSMILLAVSDFFIVPAVLGALTKYANPKYLAIILSASFVFNWALWIPYVFLLSEHDKSLITPNISLIIGSAILGLFGIGRFI